MKSIALVDVDHSTSNKSVSYPAGQVNFVVSPPNSEAAKLMADFSNSGCCSIGAQGTYYPLRHGTYFPTKEYQDTSTSGTYINLVDVNG